MIYLILSLIMIEPVLLIVIFAYWIISRKDEDIIKWESKVEKGKIMWYKKN